MRPTVSLQLPDGSIHELGHGDLIGRLWTAALHLDDGRISEFDERTLTFSGCARSGARCEVTSKE